MSEREHYFIIFNFKLFILYWGIARRQCSGSFRWTAEDLRHTYILYVQDTYMHNMAEDIILKMCVYVWVERESFMIPLNSEHS